MLANKNYEPSYVSLESALAYYEVIPETVFGVTSISSRKTQKFESNWGTFNYRSVKPLFMIGYQVIEDRQGSKFKIARLEKAVLDYLYLHHEIRAAEDLEELRWNKEQLQGALNWTFFSKYAAIYNKKALGVRIKILKEYLNV